MLGYPVFTSLFLLTFVIIWIIACGLIALVSGWYRFAKTHSSDIERETSTISNFNSIQFNVIGSYNYSIQIMIHKDGFTLKPHLLFKAFHKSLFISWKEISETKDLKEFFLYPALDVYVNGNKIRFYGKAIGLIKSGVSSHS